MVQRNETVLVVDFGAQYAQLIARRVRELNVYSEIVPHRITAAELVADPPAALILSGGPKSVHVEGAPSLDPAIYDLGIPILGICYGIQLIAQQLGGEVGRGMRGEYGRAKLEVVDGPSALLHDLPSTHDVWMSHFDAVARVPEGFVATASTADAPVAALESAVPQDLGSAVPSRGRALAAWHGHSCSASCTISPAASRRGRWTRSSTRRSRRSAPRSARPGRSAG